MYRKKLSECKFTENLNVGDKVVVISKEPAQVGTVIKKTPTGLIDVTYGAGVVKRYNQDGNERGNYSIEQPNALLPWSQAREEAIKAGKLNIDTRPVYCYR